ILGSNSFSGATFADHLAARGYDVLATSRSDEPHEALLPYKWQKRPGMVRFMRIDLNSDLDTLKTLLQRERPTHVVNFAAQSMVGESWLHPDYWMMTNVVSTVRLHELLRSYDGLERGLGARGRAVQSVDALCGLARGLRYEPAHVFCQLRLPRRLHPRRQCLRPRPAALPYRAAHDSSRNRRGEAPARRRRQVGASLHPHDRCVRCDAEDRAERTARRGLSHLRL